ncbi:MAG: hypothetical protein EOP83_10320 [Verrucomicrobiaceae bacterium]|nr:MAG: hypothetical protein EOP83_10320 [Verrucomicrobiaceae bacterium]
MKRSFLFLFLLVPIAVGEPFGGVMEPVESPAKEIKGLEFSVVTQALWSPSTAWVEQDVVLQLRIVNRGKEPLLFPTFDSFKVMLSGIDGKPQPLGGNRDGTTVTQNLLLRPGQGISYPLVAKLKSDPKEVASASLAFGDRTGSGSVTSLKPGDYSISVSVFPSHYDFSKSGKLPAPLWDGEGSTNPVQFKVAGLPASK